MAFCHINKLFFTIVIKKRTPCTSAYTRSKSLFCTWCHFFKDTFIHIRALGLRQLFKASVRKHTLFQAAWNHTCGKLSGDHIFGKLHSLDSFFCVSYRSSDKEFVSAFFKNICRFLDFSEVIVGSHVCFCKGKAYQLCFSWQKKTGFCKGGKLAGRFFQDTLWSFKIKLYYFFSSCIPCIGNLYFCKNFLLCFPHCCIIQVKGGVGKSVSKGINNLRLCSRDSFKVAVAYINILSVVYIIKGFMEVCSRWIVINAGSKGINQFTGWISLSNEELCHNKSAFHSSLPSEKCRRDLVIIFYPGKVDDTTDIKDYNNVVETFFYHSYHCFFTGSEIKISVRENNSRSFWHGDFIFPWIKLIVALYAGTVPAFTGETADHNYGNISKCLSPICQFCWKLRFYSHAWSCAVFILVADICIIKCR